MYIYAYMPVCSPWTESFSEAEMLMPNILSWMSVVARHRLEYSIHVSAQVDTQTTAGMGKNCIK